MKPHFVHKLGTEIQTLHITRHHQTSPDITRHPQTSPDIPTHHHTSPHITTHHHTLPKIITHHHTSTHNTAHHTGSSVDRLCLYIIILIMAFNKEILSIHLCNVLCKGAIEIKEKCLLIELTIWIWHIIINSKSKWIFADAVTTKSADSLKFELSQTSVSAVWPFLYVLIFCAGCWRAVQ